MLVIFLVYLVTTTIMQLEGHQTLAKSFKYQCIENNLCTHKQ